MKSLFAVVAVGFLFAAGAFAETSEDVLDARKPRLGIEAGVIMSDLNGGPGSVTTSQRTGFAAGIHFEVPLNENLAIQPEAIFAQRGADLDVANIRFAAKYNSIEVPILLKAKLAGKVSPFLVAGPAAIFNISSSVEAATPAGNVSAGFNPQTFDFGAAVGGGVDIGPLFATARYTIGIIDVSDNSAQWKSRGIHVLAGVRL